MQFDQEFPSTASRAFLTSTGNNIFDVGIIHQRLQHIHETPPLKICPHDLPVDLKQWFNRGLSIWRTPTKGKYHYLGCDAAEGLGGARDSSVVEIFDEDGFQCAEFHCNNVKPHIFAMITYSMAIYYERALVVCEKASAGHIIVDKLYNDLRYARMYMYRSYDARGKSKLKAGFETNQKSKALLISDLVEMFETGQLCINSEYLLKEMQLFVHTDSGKMEATKGNHDDSVLACGLSCVGLKNKAHYRFA